MFMNVKTSDDNLDINIKAPLNLTVMGMLSNYIFRLLNAKIATMINPTDKIAEIITAIK